MKEDQLLLEMVEYETDLDWFIENHDKLADRYSNKYVAILGGKVIGDDSSIEKLEKSLQNEYGQYLSHILVEFVYEEAPNFVL